MFARVTRSSLGVTFYVHTYCNLCQTLAAPDLRQHGMHYNARSPKIFAQRKPFPDSQGTNKLYMLCLKKFLLINCSTLKAFRNFAYWQLETFSSLDIKTLFSIFDQTPQLIGLILFRGVLCSYIVPYMHCCTLSMLNLSGPFIIPFIKTDKLLS